MITTSDVPGGTIHLILLAGAAALAMPGVAYAQDQNSPAASAEGDAVPNEDDFSTGNEIIVTATKREQTLQEIPVAVSVTTAETIERAQIRDIADLQSVVPSLRVTQSQGQFATTYNIRGFGRGPQPGDRDPGRQRASSGAPRDRG